MKPAFRRIVASVLEWQVRRLIRRKQPKVVAVAGSVGKTSTKMAVAMVLSQKYRTLAHQGNYNSELGLPLSVFRLTVPRILFNPFAWVWCFLRAEGQIWGRYPYKVLVLELGTDHPGEIPRYVRYLSPDLGIISAVSPEHMELFANLDEVAAEELELVPACKQVLADSDEIAPRYREKYIEKHGVKYEYYGLEVKDGYSFKITDANPLTGTSGSIMLNSKVVLKGVMLQVYGAHMVKRALAAYAAGKMLGLSGEQLEAGLEQITAVPGRMQPLSGIEGTTLIDDTYNSSPSAAKAALEALSAAPGKGRRIAVMGTMNELGRESPRYHEEVGGAAAGVDLLITVGADAVKHLGPAAVKAGLDPTRLKPADSPYLAADFLKLMLQPGDIVLLKGSQNGVFLEEAVKRLLADPSDSSKLVRQSPAWLKTKRAQFGPNVDPK
jgi:UDP-N-acetylmuramoyl-tripeptide--D-alanyl-D-alanine ligase